MARSRKRSIAQTIIVLSDALSGAALDNLTPEQRSSLTSADTGAIIRSAMDFAQKICGILEERAKGGTDGR